MLVGLGTEPLLLPERRSWDMGSVISKENLVIARGLICRPSMQQVPYLHVLHSEDHFFFQSTT